MLNRDDDIGVLSYDWGMTGGGIGGSQWDYPLQPKGSGDRVKAAIKNMVLGDMPDFDDALTLALYGTAENPGLLDSDARQKHVIIISDMDPSPPSNQLLQAYIDNQISISTVQVAGHGAGLMQVAKNLAEKTGGTAYGPIEQNPSQLPQIFIKEATIVRRTLIKEDDDGIPVVPTLDAGASELMRGVNPEATGPIFGMILTTLKESPLVEAPLLAGDEQDPLFAHWTAGLGKSAAWTSDAIDRWAAPFVASGQFGKFWAQVVRGVARAPQSADYEVTTTVENGRGKIVVEAVGEDARFKSDLAVAGSVLTPGGVGQSVTLVQTRPGTYEAEFDAREEGSYVVALNASGPEGASALRGGTSVNGSEELLALASDLPAIERVAEATGGRVLPAFTKLPIDNGLFARSWVDAMGNEQTLSESKSPLPVWDWLVPLLIAMLLVDVAIRRIAWDRSMLIAARQRVTGQVTRLTATTRQDRSGSTLGELRTRRTEVVDRTRKFEAAEGATGDVSSLGATSATAVAESKAKPTARPNESAAPESSGGIGSLMEAKRRARERMESDE